MLTTYALRVARDCLRHVWREHNVTWSASAGIWGKHRSLLSVLIVLINHIILNFLSGFVGIISLFKYYGHWSYWLVFRNIVVGNMFTDTEI